MQSTSILLHNIRSAHNVGSIFRTADGAGATRIYLSGFTSRPVDRFGRIQPEIQKTSLGASETVPWEFVEDAEGFLQELKKEHVEIVVVEQDERSIPLHEFKRSEHVLYVFGNEIEGVDPNLRSFADVIVEIPMHGTKESLNVSVAAGIVLFSPR